MSPSPSAAHSLPVASRLPDIVTAVSQSLAGGFVVLRAEPGSGKTSLVPAALADHVQGVVLVTEPRRLAAIGAANYAAALRSEEAGGFVGYAVRGDRRWGPATRVLYVTEGVAINLLCDREFVARLGVLIIDEFHERHGTTDALMLLARRWSLSARAAADEGGAVGGPRPGFPAFVLMSATFDESRLGAALQPLKLVDIPGVIYPLEVVYDPPHVDRDPLRPAASLGLSVWGLRESWFHVPSVILREAQGVARAGGGILCFLPGKREITRVGDALRLGVSQVREQAPGVVVEELHGERPLPELMRAVARRVLAPGEVVVYLATNIAESSVTIPGVRVVIDTGLARAARHHLNSGTVELSLIRIGQHSAVQRAGRAAREQAGRAIRVYGEDDFLRRPKESEPEICRSDLSRDLLDLLRSFEALFPAEPVPRTLEEWLRLPWIDVPPSDRIEAALTILQLTGALDGHGHLTEFGRRLSDLPLTVRLGRVALGASERYTQGLLARPVFVSSLLLCAVLSEGDVVPSAGASAGGAPVQNPIPDPSTSDDNALGLQWQALRRALSKSPAGSDPEILRRGRRILDAARSIVRGLGLPAELLGESLDWVRDLPVAPPLEEWGALFFCGYSDAFAMSSATQSLTHMNGETFVAPCVAGPGGYLVIEGVRLHGAAQSSARKLASKVLPLDPLHVVEGPPSWLKESCEAEITKDGDVVTVRVRDVVRYGTLAIEERMVKIVEPAFREGLRLWIERDHAERIIASDGMQALVRRLALLGGDAEATAAAADLGVPAYVAARAADYICASFPASSLSVRFEWVQLMGDDALQDWVLEAALGARVRRLVPHKLRLDNGVSVSVDYAVDPPALVGRIQDFFGLLSHPSLGSGRVKPAIRLLAPGGQTAQITADLVSFWSSSYPAVKKAYLGRYPRHHWPDDPTKAPPLLTKRQVAQSDQAKQAGGAKPPNNSQK